MKCHPASALFPLMGETDLARLTEDIRERGLFKPIVLHEGEVLDGRNRLRACELAGVEPRSVEWEPNGASPAEWVIRENLQWRHLTAAQKAALALDVLPQLEAEANERMLAGKKVDPPSHATEGPGEAVEKAAHLVGIGRTSVKLAKGILSRGRLDLIDRMRAGTITLRRAATEAGYPAWGNQAQAPICEDAPSVYYGKGDRWREASEPLRRYLAGWGKRGFLFTAVNREEAERRIRKIDALIAALTEAKADLEVRALRTPKLKI